MTTGLEWMFKGNLFNAFFQPFIDIGIGTSMLFSLFLGIGLMLYYIKTRNIGLVALGIVMFSPIFLGSMGGIPIQRYLFATMFIGFVFLIYRLLRSR
jgi:hypothetical protein